VDTSARDTGHALVTVDVRIAHASALIATKGVASSEVEAVVLHTHEVRSDLSAVEPE
jgi:hypothetical protein